MRRLSWQNVVFIADDDEDLLLEDEWQTDSMTTSDMERHAGQVQLQLRLCFVAAVTLPLLAVLISLAWRRYRDAIQSATEEEEAEAEVEQDRKKDR